MNKNQEIRSYKAANVRALSDESEQATLKIGGLAARYNSPSENLGGFYEVILPGAFDDVMNDDVVCLFNHNDSQILGRTSAGNMRIFLNEEGLNYEVDLPNNQIGRDLYESVKRGDVTQSSFAFGLSSDGFTISTDESGAVVQTISKVARLYDCSPVVRPAYQATSVSLRKLEDFEQKGIDNSVNNANMRLNRFKLSGLFANNSDLN